MAIQTKDISHLMSARWMPALAFFLTLLLSGLAGGLAAWFMRSFAGQEMLILLVSVGLWLAFLLSAIKFDMMVLVSFCLLGLVQIEPAPVDILSILLLLVGLLTGRLSLKVLGDSLLIHLTLWGFLLANFASLMVAKAVFDSGRFLMITLYLIAFFYFVKMYTTSARAMRNIIIGYMVSALTTVGFVTLAYFGIGTEFFIKHGTRANGFFKDANVFGPFLIPIIILLIDELLYPCLFRGGYAAKILGVIALTSGVILSGSRAAWGNLIVSLLVYFSLTLKYFPWTRLPYLLSLLIASSTAIPWLLERIGFQEILKDRAQFQPYDVNRFARQGEGIQAGLTHWIGVGPGMWTDAHSLYVRAFAEQGVLGLISTLLYLLILFIRTLLQAIREVGKPYGVSAKVLAACLVGLFLNSFVIDTIHWRHFWLILGLSWVVSIPGTAQLYWHDEDDRTLAPPHATR